VQEAIGEIIAWIWHGGLYVQEDCWLPGSLNEQFKKYKLHLYLSVDPNISLFNSDVISSVNSLTPAGKKIVLLKKNF
jgi:hypothetical protein